MKKTICILYLLMIFSSPVWAQFDGIVGTTGCQAIHWQDTAIKGWATGCQVIRGHQDIATKNMLANYGLEEAAIGSAGESAMDAVSLGDSGIAILTFDIPIYDGEGYDFAIFENSINDYFLELAFVEVSSDGVHWVRFPAKSLTPTNEQIDGFGRIDATLINNFAGKYRLGWGTPFDLNELADSNDVDIQNITHVKLIDVIGCIQPEYASYDAFGNRVNDPYPTDFHSGGFDLTGVAIMNGWSPSRIQSYSTPSFSIYPNPVSDFVTIQNAIPGIVKIVNMTGQVIMEKYNNDSTIVFDVRDYPTGLYVIQINNQRMKMIKN